MELFKPNSNFDFMGIRKPVIVLSLLLIVASIGALALRGINFALDFTGGTLVEVRFDQPADIDGVTRLVADAGYPNATVQSFGTSRDVVIRLQPRTDQDPQEVSRSVFDALKRGGNAPTLKRSDFVGPQVGKELAENGAIAVIVVILGILVYIGARFEKKFAIAAIGATMHDVLLTIGYFALTQKEFDLNVLAGVMSVVGYSINDKIVVFDRVRENFRNLRHVSAAEVLNRSINQTLSRTVINSFVAFLTVLALFLYGGSALRLMSEALMIGIVIGTLSSIFTACPLLLWLGVTKQDLMPKAKDLSELERRP
ncbi:MAG TPA: protein translocase subunit SecF [Candidatus Saccharimonadia bacterium]|nr:protein translocase subunit SecF [Candidatus Saccharimonadia bacterium]